MKVVLQQLRFLLMKVVPEFAIQETCLEKPGDKEKIYNQKTSKV